MGTGPDCALILDDPSVSEAQCEIEVSDDRAVVRDLASATGTLIDGMPVQQEILRPVQQLQLGSVQFSYPEESIPQARPVAYTPAVHVAATQRRRGVQTLPEDASFGAQLGESFAYASRRDGLVLLICGTIVFSLFEIAQLVLITLRFAWFQ
ncbi:MAG: FHA domain-containing protein [Verrucomicrobia bacterium]|nr:FHA domain-containing protein [Verrucomicrobiota bacterium]